MKTNYWKDRSYFFAFFNNNIYMMHFFYKWYFFEGKISPFCFLFIKITFCKTGFAGFIYWKFPGILWVVQSSHGFWLLINNEALRLSKLYFTYIYFILNKSFGQNLNLLLKGSKFSRGVLVSAAQKQRAYIEKNHL